MPNRLRVSPSHWCNCSVHACEPDGMTAPLGSRGCRRVRTSYLPVRSWARPLAPSRTFGLNVGCGEWARRACKRPCAHPGRDKPHSSGSVSAWGDSGSRGRPWHFTACLAHGAAFGFALQCVRASICASWALPAQSRSSTRASTRRALEVDDRPSLLSHMAVRDQRLSSFARREVSARASRCCARHRLQQRNEALPVGSPRRLE